MNFRNLDLNLLAAFDAIIAEGNLTRAAARLAMSQPALSNALARLRAAVDDPLFTRTSRGMLPTPRARLLAPHIRQALDLVRNALTTSTAFDYRSSRRRFVIAVEDYGEAVILPRFMDWLSHAAPGLELYVRPIAFSSLREELTQGEVDMAVSYFRIKSPEFRSATLMEDSAVSMVRRDHPEVGDSLSVEQYLALSHVVLMPRTADRPVIDRVLDKMRLKRRVALQVPHFLSMPLIVKSTDFICTVPRRMANVYAENFQLRILKTPVECPDVPIYLVWHESQETEVGHAWLRESIRQLCHRL